MNGRLLRMAQHTDMREMGLVENGSDQLNRTPIPDGSDQLNRTPTYTGECAAYSGDPRLMFGGPLCQEQMMAVEFCSKNVEVVQADCATRAESIASMFQIMEKLSYRLE